MTMTNVTSNVVTHDISLPLALSDLCLAQCMMNRIWHLGPRHKDVCGPIH